MRNELPNLIQKIKLRTLDLYPYNKIYSTVCDGVITWWDVMTPLMEHDVDDPPDDFYIHLCLGEYYGKNNFK